MGLPCLYRRWREFEGPWDELSDCVDVTATKHKRNAGVRDLTTHILSPEQLLQLILFYQAVPTIAVVCGYLLSKPGTAQEQYRLEHDISASVAMNEERSASVALAASKDVSRVEAPVTVKAYAMCAFAAFGGIFFGYVCCRQAGISSS